MSSEQKCPKCEACEQVLIWSIYNRAWYRPQSCGYTGLVIEAGRFWRCEADAEVKGAPERIRVETVAEAETKEVDGGTQDLANRHIAELRRQLAALTAERDRLGTVLASEQAIEAVAGEIGNCGGHGPGMNGGQCDSVASRLRVALTGETK